MTARAGRAHSRGMPHDIPNRTPEVLQVDGLRKRYGTTEIVRDLSFSVIEGEIFGLLGSNGAGKTTTVEIVQGLRDRDGGSVSLFGHDPARNRAALRPLVGSQLQSSALPDRLRVGEALRLFARLAGDVVDWRQVRERWNLAPIERTAFGALSGGQRQRLFLALALINQPRLVFLDELTQGLDAAARRQTWDLIEEVRAAGTTVVLVTHFMDEAERLCDRIGVLDGGAMRFVGRPDQLIGEVGGPTRIAFTVHDPGLLAGIERVPGIVDVNLWGDEAELRCTPSSVVAVIAAMHQHGVEPDDLRVVRPTLEDAFVALTTDLSLPSPTMTSAATTSAATTSGAAA